MSKIYTASILRRPASPRSAKLKGSAATASSSYSPSSVLVNPAGGDESVFWKYFGLDEDGGLYVKKTEAGEARNFWTYGQIAGGGLVSNGNGGVGVSYLRLLLDVYHNNSGVILRSDGATTLQDGDTLAYDSTNSRWYARPGLVAGTDYLTPAAAASAYAAKSLEGIVAGIQAIIPAAASSSNQLADKAFVNSSIATNTGTFQGTFSSTAQLPSSGVSINDYAFVTTTDANNNTVYSRYKYNGAQWVFEYSLNNSSFTAAQWNAINSSVTSGKVSGYDAHLIDNDIHITSAERTAWNAKTSNLGTITGITMNGVSRGINGVVDLGTVLTEHQSLAGYQTLLSATNLLNPAYVDTDASHRWWTDTLATSLSNKVDKVTDTGSGSTKPVYMNSSGEIKPCSQYAGGTLVKLNNSLKQGATASFYAPTGYGTNGYYLAASGTQGVAPSWAAPGSIAQNEGALVTGGTVYSHLTGNYLPLTGGTLSKAGYDILSLRNTSGDNINIRFFNQGGMKLLGEVGCDGYWGVYLDSRDNSGDFVGGLGVFPDGTPFYSYPVTGGQNWKRLLHEGNWGSFIYLDLPCIDELSNTTDLNTIHSSVSASGAGASKRFGFYSQIAKTNADTAGVNGFPASNYSNALLTIDTYNYDEYIGLYQLGFSGNGNIYYRYGDGTTPFSNGNWNRIVGEDHNGDVSINGDIFLKKGEGLWLDTNKNYTTSAYITRGGDANDFALYISPGVDGNGNKAYTYVEASALVVPDGHIAVNAGYQIKLNGMWRRGEPSDPDYNPADPFIGLAGGKAAYKTDLYISNQGYNIYHYANAHIFSGQYVKPYDNNQTSLGTLTDMWSGVWAKRWYPNQNDTDTYIEYVSGNPGYFRVHGNIVADGQVSAGGIFSNS